jgi:glycerate-2-kinase
VEVTLTVKVERGEDFEILKALLDILERQEGVRTAQQELATGQPWTEEAFTKLWSVIPEQAREVMREIAKKPEGYPANLLTNNLNIKAAELGRCVSSIAHQIERTDSHRRFKRPVVRDWESEIYMMPEDVAELIRRPNR